MKNIYTYFLGIILSLIGSQAYAQLSPYDLNKPVGFGEKVTGGEGGRNITVTTRSELSNALKTTDKAIIYIKGAIEVNSMLKVVAKNKTILGLPGSYLYNNNRTQSGSGILYLSQGSNNVIIRNVTFKSAGAYDVDGNDNLCIDKATYIWVDHCDFQDGVDGNFDCKNASDNIAVTWCRFRYLIDPMAGGSGGSNDHRFSNLWGSSDDATGDRNHLNTTFQFCMWESCAGRMPRVRFGKVHLINCYYKPKSGANTVQCGNESSLYIENCMFDGKQNPWYDYTAKGAAFKVTETGSIFNNCSRPSDTGTGTAFTPNYATTISAIPASNVKDAVTGDYGAGATLIVKENEGVITTVDGKSTDTSLSSLSVNNINIPVSKGVYSYSVILEESATVSSIIATANDNKASVSNITLPTALPATVTFTVTAENGTIATYTLLIKESSKSAIWDFSSWSDATLTNLASDASNWNAISETRYSNEVTMSGTLSANSTTIYETEGLIFGSYAKDKIRINHAETSNGSNLQLNGGKLTITIPECNANDEITIDFSSTNTEERGWTVDNASPTTGTLITTRDKQTFTVTTNGSVTFSTTSGLLIFSIERHSSSTGISTAETDNSEIIKTEYYSISGIKLQVPQKGFNIVRYFMKDGTTKSKKIFF